jgi:hypothetical protein
MYRVPLKENDQFQDTKPRDPSANQAAKKIAYNQHYQVQHEHSM